MPNEPQTGRTQLNSQLIDGARSLAGPAADLASGASLFQAATNALKGAALEKLLGPTALFAGGLVGVLSVIRKIVRESQLLEKGLANVAKIQQIEGKFTTLLKSAELAKKRIAELYAFTANSPFRFDDVAEANRILEALTRGAYSGAAAMEVVGDTAAATGQSISDTAEKVGKLYNALSSGRSIDRIAYQLQFTGLVTDGLLGKLENLEKAGAGFAEQWNEVTKVLAVNQGGMKNEQKSLDALQTKLDEASTQMAQAFGQPFVNAQSRSIEVMTAATKNLTPVLRTVGEDLAAVSGLVTNFKTGLVENTLATSGFGSALRVAWEIGKGLFITLSALTALNAIKGAAPAAAFVGRALGTAKNSLKAARASDAGTVAATAAEVASSALASGNLKLAATEGLVAAQFQVSSRFAAVKAAALQAAAGATGFAAVQNGVLAASSVIAGGAMSLLGRVAVSAGAAIRGAFAAVFANPLGIAITSTYALITGYNILSRASNEAADGLRDVKAAAADLNRELNRTEDAFQTTDDWALYMTRIANEIAKAETEAAKFKQTLADRGIGTRIVDAITDSGASKAETAKGLENNVTDLRKRREASLRFLPTLGMGEREAEAFARDLRNAKDKSDNAFQNRLSLADDQAAIRLLDQEIAKIDKLTRSTLAVRDAQEKFNRSRAKIVGETALTDAASSRDVAEKAARDAGLDLGDGKDVKKQRDQLAAFATSPLPKQIPGLGADAANSRESKARAEAARKAELLTNVISATDRVTAAEQALAALRRSSDSELIRNNQRLIDLRKNASGSEAARQEIQQIEKRNLALLESVRIVDDEIKRSQQLKFERQQRANAVALAETAISFDTQINAATARGDNPEAERLSFLKQIATIEKEIAQAREQGNGLRVQQLTTERNGVAAERDAHQQRFREDTALEAERNRALINRSGQKAQAVDDFKTLRDLKEAFRTNGLSDDDARRAFDLSVKARLANAELPRIAVDSLQAIGGGGGSSNDYLQRQVTLSEATVKHLSELVKLARSYDGVARFVE